MTIWSFIKLQNYIFFKLSVFPKYILHNVNLCQVQNLKSKTPTKRPKNQVSNSKPQEHGKYCFSPLNLGLGDFLSHL